MIDFIAVMSRNYNNRLCSLQIIIKKIPSSLFFQSPPFALIEYWNIEAQFSLHPGCRMNESLNIFVLLNISSVSEAYCKITKWWLRLIIFPQNDNKVNLEIFQLLSSSSWRTVLHVPLMVEAGGNWSNWEKNCCLASFQNKFKILVWIIIFCLFRQANALRRTISLRSLKCDMQVSMKHTVFANSIQTLLCYYFLSCANCQIVFPTTVFSYFHQTVYWSRHIIKVNKISTLR